MPVTRTVFDAYVATAHRLGQRAGLLINVHRNGLGLYDPFSVHRAELEWVYVDGETGYPSFNTDDATGVEALLAFDDALGIDAVGEVGPEILL